MLVLAAPIAALITGCSMSQVSRTQASPHGAGSGPRLARIELRTRANAICERRRHALDQLPRPGGRVATRRFFARIAELERTEFLALSGLRPPRADERNYLRFLATSLALVRVADRFHAAVVAGDTHARRRALADADRVSQSYDRAAARVGLSCRQTA
jgi:hypothetical protein